MKILYVLGSVQHPTIMRGALRHYHFLRELASRHSITLVALMDGDMPPEARDELEAITDRLVIVPVAGSSGPRPAHVNAVHRLRRKLQLRRAVGEMRRAFRGIRQSEGHDVLLFHGKRVYPVIAGTNGIPTVVDVCDATSLRHRERLRHAALSAMPWRLAGYASALRTERRLVGKTPHLAFISMRDRDAVLGPAAGAQILPNGIDLDYWTRSGGAEDEDSLVFTGVMDYAPNEDAALQLIRSVLPIVRRSRPEMKLVIAGRDPTRTLVELAARTEGVTVTGFVEDLRPHLERGSIYTAPIRYASGLQNKILEALAMRVPVVTTPVVAEGLRIDGAAEPPVRIAEGAAPFAQAVLSLLHDREERRRLAAEGRRFVEAHFDWVRGAASLEAMCLEAASSGLGMPSGGRSRGSRP